MKLTKLEGVTVLITLAALAVMAFFFLSGGSGSDTAAIITPRPAESSAAASPSPSESTALGSAAPEASAPPEEDEAEGSFPININTATAEELQALPGIGAVRAQAIVDYRTEHGLFTYVEDLRGVSGIGEATLAKLMEYITVGE